MQTQCPRCKRPRDLPDAYAGRQIKCPDCGHPHTLAAGAPPPPCIIKPDPAKREARLLHPPARPDSPPSAGYLFWTIGILIIVMGFVVGGAADDALTVIGSLVGGLLLMTAASSLDYLCKITWHLKKLRDRKSVV